MDLINNALMASVKTPQERPAQSSVKKDGEAGGFQDLMDQKQTSAPSDDTAAVSGTEQPQQTEVAKPQEAEAVQPVQDPKELERQMVLAAMAVMQNNPALANLAEETPQVLSDPNWEEGLVPVGFDDANGFRIVHWMQPESAGMQPESEEAGEVLAQWVEDQNAQETNSELKVETQVDPDEVLEQAAKDWDAEIKVEQGGVENQSEDEAGETPEEASAMETPVFEDVKAVPVKVGEAPAAKETEAPVEKQVIPQLTEALQNGETKVEIQLTPENLGKVKIEMTWREDGSILVQMHAESSRTQGLLEKNLSSLEAMLSRTTRQEVQVEVPRNQEGQQQQNLYDQEEQQQRHGRQEEQKRRQAVSGEDFLQQLRLGLIPLDGV